MLVSRGPECGYFINATKSGLLVKPHHEGAKKKVFGDTGIVISMDGHRHLGAALDTEEFCSSYLMKKAEQWCAEVKQLAVFPATQPQAAYTVFTSVLRHKWSFIARTMPGAAEELKLVEQVVSEFFLPALLGRASPGALERQVLALPCRHGRLGLVLPMPLAGQFQYSTQVTAPLVENILAQESLIEGIRVATETSQ